MDLYKGHIGDGLPLCSDFPDRAFLLEGAKWRYLGKSSKPQLMTDPDGLAGVELDERSVLYDALCSEAGGECQYKSQVTLTSNLRCFGREECLVQTLRVVKVKDAHYEYVRPACMEMSFFDDAVKILKDNKRDGLCANKKHLVASPSCCALNNFNAGPSCVYGGERVDYAAAVQKCDVSGRRMCDGNNINRACIPSGYFWTDTECRVNMKVRVDGQIAIVHDFRGGRTTTFSINNMLHSVRESSKTFFRVDWLGGTSTIPTVDNGCLNGLCTVFQEEFCMCSKTVTESAAFDAMPSKDEIKKGLHVGSLKPSAYDGTYTLVESGGDGINLYALDINDKFSVDSIFEVTVNGVLRYFRNKRSMVMLSDTVGFRNPATIMDLSEPTARDAQHETEAFVDHLMFHENTPPFIAYRMIQRFVTSNPSPRYVDVVATAFSSGEYDGIGSQKWGDLAATMAAILLDKEARNAALDYDPAFGQLREPVIKWMHGIRSLEGRPIVRGRQFEPNRLEFWIAEEPHRQPNVFNYFRPEFSPPGPVANAGLVAPEAQILTTPRIVNFINGMVSVAKFGVGSCASGFNRHAVGNEDCGARNRDRDTSMNRAQGKMNWRPLGGLAGTTKTKALGELDLLLTGGRLSPDTYEDYYEAYDKAFAKKSGTRLQKVHYGIMALQQLLLTSPEFQITNHAQRYGERRPEAEKRNGTEPYKAVINLFLGGGLDSYNLIIPMGGCKNGKDMFAEYTQVRGDVALLRNTLRPIDVPAGSQVCEEFGIHKEMPFLQKMYEQGDALFLANIGVMAEPITKAELLDGSKEVPESLFAHNIQQQSTQTLQPQDRSTVGVLGRMNDILWEKGFSSGAYSMASGNFVLEPEGLISPAQVFLSAGGLAPMNPSQHNGEDTREHMYNLAQNKSRSLHAETWSSLFEFAYNETLNLKSTLDSTSLLTWPTGGALNSQLRQQMEQVAKLIKSHGQLGQDRQSFFVEVGGFDTHSDNGNVLTGKFKEINHALEVFQTELEAQGLWDNVVIIESSDFARTITSNGAGTDHGWGGHYVLLGGNVKGGDILGVYPDDLTPRGDLNIGRGRFIPSYSWEAVWYPLAIWYGIPGELLNRAMPLLGRFGDQDLFAPGDFFTEGSFTFTETNDPSIVAYIVLGVASFVLISMLGGMIFLVYNRKGEIKQTARRLSAILDSPVRVESTRVGNQYTETSSGYGNHYAKQEFSM